MGSRKCAIYHDGYMSCSLYSRLTGTFRLSPYLGNNKANKNTVGSFRYTHNDISLALALFNDEDI